MTAELQKPRLHQVRIHSDMPEGGVETRGGEKAAYLQKTMGISREMPSLPLPTLK